MNTTTSRRTAAHNRPASHHTQPTPRQLAAAYIDARSKEGEQSSYHDLANAIYQEATHRRGKDAAQFLRIIRK